MRVKIRLFRPEMLPSLLITILFGASLFGLLFFRLGSLTPGLAPAEKSAFVESNSIAKIIDNPVNAPYKIAQLAAVKSVGSPSALSLRVIPAIIGLLSAGFFYYILRHWHTPRIAALGTLLYASSNWFLHTARYSQPNISLLLIVPLMAFGVWQLTTKRFNASLLIAVIAAVMALYTPLLPWFLVLGAVWQRRRIWSLIKHADWSYRIASAFTLIILCVPLVMAFTTNSHLLISWLGLPEHLPNLRQLALNFANTISALFWKSTPSPTTNLGDLPRLDIFASAMLFMGLYASYFKLKLDRGRILLVGLIGSIILSTIGGQTNLVLILPFIYILITAGITLMIQQWFTVFPRNPVARVLGFVIITAVVFLSVFYNLNRYFIAWPNAPETKAAFSLLK